MTLQAYCSNCQKTVHVDEGATAFCPVCSSPLLQTVEPAED